MKPIKSLCILGGDVRQAYLAQALSEEGFQVRVAALDQYVFSDQSIKVGAIERAIEKSDCVILPLPVTMDGITLNAPMTVKKIDLNRDFMEMLEGKYVMGGQIEKIPHVEEWKRVELVDYYAQEALIVGNAVLTSEAAISIAVGGTPYGLLRSKCLVLGFGRIGRSLSTMLKGMGCDVTVSARKKEDFAWIEALGLKAVHTSMLGEHVKEMDILFNTVPFVLMTGEILEQCKSTVLVIDLASKPGGVDYIRAEELGIKALKAFNLPGKFSPRSAADLIKLTVTDMIEEVNKNE